MIAGFVFAMAVWAQSAAPAVTAPSSDDDTLRIIAAMKRAVYTAGMCDRYVRPGGNLDETIEAIFNATGQPVVDAVADEIKAELARGRRDPRRATLTAQQCRSAIERRMAELKMVNSR